MQESAPEAGVTIFMPHVMDSAMKKTADVARRLGLVNRGRKLIKMTPQHLEMLNYQLENPIDEDVFAYLDNKDILVVLWMADPGVVAHETLTRFVEKVTELTPMVIEDESGNAQTVEIKILEPLIIYLDQDNRSLVQSFSQPIDQTNPVAEQARPSTRPSQYQRASRASQWTRRSTKPQRPLLIIPPVWTPANQAGNAMHCFAFFRNVRTQIVTA